MTQAKAKDAKKPHATVKSLEKKINEITSNIDSQFEQILGLMKAKDNPVSITKDGVHTEDVYQKLDHGTINIKTDSRGDVQIEEETLQSVNCSEFKEKLDQMKFDLESLQVMVMPSQSTYPDHTFTVGVNGKLKVIVRGTKQWLPRCYVEVLLRAKTSNYGNVEVINAATGNNEINNPETKAHRYPLQILQDPSGVLGAQWMERVTNDMRA